MGMEFILKYKALLNVGNIELRTTKKRVQNGEIPIKYSFPSQEGKYSRKILQISS